MENSVVLHKINCPEGWESKNDYDSHKPLLWLMIELGHPQNIVELGCGFGSTPMFEKWEELGGVFLSYETNKEWADKFPSTNHIENYGDLLFMGIGLLFVDCAPGELRKELVNDFRNSAEIIVVHDTEEGAEYVYGMKDCLSKFKYRIDYKPEKAPHTTAVSNSIDITKWIN